MPRFAAKEACPLLCVASRLAGNSPSCWRLSSVFPAPHGGPCGHRFGIQGVLPLPTSSPLLAKAIAVAFLRSFIRRNCTIVSSPTTSPLQFSVRRPCCNGLALLWRQFCNEPLILEFRIHIVAFLDPGLMLFDIAVKR